MIRLKAEEYLGRPWLLVYDQLDGYKKPYRIRIFEITEEELDFVSGRFERMVNSSVKPFEHKIEIGDEESYNPEDIITWIYENTNGLWNFDISDTQWKSEWIFSFQEDEDAVAFKLRWVGQ